MYGYIYETENLINGKKYIGLHRWNENKLDESYLGSGVALVKAVKNTGPKISSAEFFSVAKLKRN